MNDTYADALRNLAEFKQNGAKSVVLDLRNNFGGPLDQARKVAALFAKGPLGYVVEPKSAKKTLSIPTDPNRYDGKVIVLVNGATLGTSELLAAALADQTKARVVGTTTFGDGLDQSLIPLDDGSALQLTTGRFLTSSGADFHQTGIKPTDIVTASPDQQLAKAMSLAKDAALSQAEPSANAGA
jgi:carboxyl-terminal processing protease